MLKIADWLNAIGMGQYTQAFLQNDVDGDVLLALTEGDLEKLGVTLGHRKKISKAIAELNVADAIDAGANRPASVVESVTAEGERRQVTVLFCDLVASVAMTQNRDPEDFRRLMESYHAVCIEAIQRLDGFVAQIQGDAVVAYFGYPIAHEAEADRAVRAGLGILKALTTLSRDTSEGWRVRIGIASGMVVVSHILAAEKSAVGETPNLAQRLQTTANPMEVIVSNRTKELAGGGFEFEDRGSYQLKGIAEPVRAWKVLGRSAVASRFEAATRHRITPLVGREQELGLMIDRWQLARSGEGQVLLLLGEPGIGKSRTMHALRERLAKDIEMALQYQCSPYHTNSAFYPIIDHLERSLGFVPSDTAEDKLNKLERRLIGEMHRSRLDCSLMARMLLIPCDERYGSFEITPQRQKDETLRALADWVAALAGQHATGLFFEDVHWADPSTLEALNVLIDRAQSLPLLIVITFRPEFESSWTARPHVTLLTLTRLSRAQSALVVGRVANSKNLPDDLAAQIIAKTEGVPLFLEELTKAVLESDLIVDRGDHFAFSGKTDRMTIPATLYDSLMARLDRLIPVKEIAQIGAVLGREFSHEIVAAVSPMSPQRLNDALERLVASELVFRRGSTTSVIYVFKHALVQDAAYDSILKSKRQALHAQIADVLRGRFPDKVEKEPELLAHHYTAAGMALIAVPFWRQAGELALRRLALTESIAHIEKGLAVNQTLPESRARDEAELAMRTVLGAAWMGLRGWPAPQISETVGPALGLAKSLGDHDALVPILWGLWVNCLTQGRIAESLDWVKECHAASAETDNENLSMMADMAAMVSYFWLGELTAARDYGDKIMQRYDEKKYKEIVVFTNHDPRTLVGIYASHWLWMLGYPEQAVTESDAKDAHGRKIGHPYDLGFALTTRSHAFAYRHEPERLQERAKEAERLGRETSVPFVSEILAQLMSGVAMLRAGSNASARQQLASAFSYWTGAGAGIWSPYLRALLAEATALDGDWHGALRLIDESIAQTERSAWKECCHLSEILRLKAWMVRANGDTAGAEDCIRKGLAHAREQKAKSWELRCAMSLAELLIESNQHAQARELLTPVYGWFTEGLDTHDLIQAKMLLAKLG